jgi:superfamily II DNA/RNA helicase
LHDDAQRQRARRRPGRDRPRSGQPRAARAPSGQQQSGQRRSGQRRSARPGGATRPRDVLALQAPPSELDRALAAALTAPPPEPATFAELGLPGELVTALAARGIHEPFAIQSRALPDALSGRDVLGKAQTGSGKTLAFGLPMLARLASQPGTGTGGSRRREKAPRGLVLVPTRELAVQVADVLEPLGRTLGVTVTTVYGGVSIGRQIDILRRGVDVVVATPGRLIDLLDRRACTLADIEITVLDEADHMADLGFLPAVTKILDATPDGGQRLLFSATLDRGVAQLVTSYLNDPAVCAVASTPIEAGTTEHSMLVLAAQDKVAVAAEIAGRPARTLFFVRTKHGADRLARQFGRAGVDAAAIHGNLNQNQRRRALAGFAAGHPRVLVATDVAARGIHVDDIELVVHFDPPNDHKDYLHRSGRTARAGADGLVVVLAEEAQVRELERLHRSAGISPDRHHVGAGHEVVRKIATSGTPVPPPPPAPVGPAAAGPGRPRGNGAAHRAGRPRNGRTTDERALAAGRRAGDRRSPSTRPARSQDDGYPRQAAGERSGGQQRPGRPFPGRRRPSRDAPGRPGRGSARAGA